MIFELYEQKYLEKVYLKLNLAQSTEQEKSTLSCLNFVSHQFLDVTQDELQPSTDS